MAWHKHNIEISKIVDGKHRAGTTHEIDHVRQTDMGSVALEIERNKMGSFPDPESENFQHLHVVGAISMGMVVTRNQSLQDEMVQIVHEFALNDGVSSCDDLVQFGVNPTTRQRQMVADVGGDFAAAWVGRPVSDKVGATTTHREK